MIYDGHVHTPYCPHGTRDTLQMYAERAIVLGYKGLTFTEHAPLPERFNDPAPDKDSAMLKTDLAGYLDSISELKQAYKNTLEIKLGLEVDYIEGYEKETAAFLNNVGPFLDDAILSVHFLLVKGRYHCLDFSLESFETLIQNAGDLETLYKRYINTVRASIHNDLGPYKPHRIGHITLPSKFQKVYPMPESVKPLFKELVHFIKEKHYTLDYNGSGVTKPYCGSPYPHDQLAVYAKSIGIPLIYGSDAHSASALGQGLDRLIEI